ncbi:PD40 domain-containing protein [Fodinibius saliphilus]|uniref:PD40 domain-containing protein n=1 Tax=Fodinibius saliphilus TaxID=1920650 RepID=UPI0011080A13|nr:PD40 domain-containing protein [Fodinibius saliphilus]
MKRIIIFFFLLFLGSFYQNCIAQFYPTQYRPSQQNWQYLNTEHFNIIYDQANDSTALATAQLLEDQYASVQELVGGKLTNFPIILNNYNDRSNGFVTPFNFRSEIELPPIKSKAMNPRTGGWLQNVAPHELVHALQFSNLGDCNIPQFVNIFSPDLARSFHGAIPSGIVEGIAVHHESEGIIEKGGRGNYPFFTNRFNAMFKSDQRWSMGQHVHFSSNTRPFDRHYVGGYEFTSWLQNKYGDTTTKEALDFYLDWPFLGYGVALRHATGDWPGQLYNQFKNDHERELKNFHSSNQQLQYLKIPFKGRKIRRPKWLSNSTLIFYGSFYNQRPGFYSYNLKNQELERFITTNTVSDFHYTLSADRSKMIYSYFEADPLYDRTYKAELVQYHFGSNQKKQLTKKGRYYAPIFDGDKLLALQSAPATSRLVALQPPPETNSQPEVLITGENYQIKAIAKNPQTNSVAVTANKNGLQALWISSRDSLQKQLAKKPDIALYGGAIFDPQWHPEGKKILFSSDASGSFQLYEYDLSTNNVVQITKNGFNAFEGSYSPNGNRIAFIRQIKNEQLPIILDRSDFVNKTVDIQERKPSYSNKDGRIQEIVSDSIITASLQWETGNYSSGLNWIKPRTVLPVFEEVSNQDVYKWGLSLHSTNTLSNQSYSAEVTFSENRFWYDLSYRNKGFYPGFRTRIYREPSYNFAQLQNSNQSITLLREERGGSISVPLPVTITQNTFFTSLFIEPEFRYSQLKFTDLTTNSFTTNFSNTAIGNIYGQFNFRLQQNIRDVQPNSGALIYAEIEHYFDSGAIDKFGIPSREPTALQGGLFTYLSPLKRWNQSLRLGIKGITQSGLIYNNQDIVSDAFSEPVSPTSNNLLSFSSRYTVPLLNADDGGFLLPLYLNNIYLVGFTDTIVDPLADNWQQETRTVFGLGLRTRFRISNMTFELGVGVGYEASRNSTHFFIGDF